MPPYSCAKGRNGILYGVNGAERGFRYHPSIGKQPIGMTAPATAPTVTLGPLMGKGGYYVGPTAASSVTGRKWPATPTVAFSGGGGDAIGAIPSSNVDITVAAGVITAIDLHTPPLGLQGYAIPPAVTISDSTGSGATAVAVTDPDVKSIDIVSGGTGYSATPSITLTPYPAAILPAAKAVLRAGRFATLQVTAPGGGIGTQPTIKLQPSTTESNASITVKAGSKSTDVMWIEVTNGGSGYTPPVTVKLDGVTSSQCSVTLAAGVVSAVNITGTSPYRGLSGYATAPAVTFHAASGSGATATAHFGFPLVYTIATAGEGYDYGRMLLTGGTKLNNLPATDPVGLATNSKGHITAVVDKVLVGGSYAPRYYIGAPSGVTLQRWEDYTNISYLGTLKQSFSGKYLCCYRFLDSTGEALGGPVPSSISPFTEIDTQGQWIASLEWSVATSGADQRATHVELFRSTADQALTLYRVAKLPIASIGTPVTHTDYVPDEWLSDEGRSEFVSLPIILPTGQVNARRHGVPPSTKKVICQFQDRMWYGGDTSGTEQNTLYFSEIDEPESVPDVNTVVIQENSRGADEVVGLIPFGSSLIAAQRRHLYRIEYSALPVLDARISLAASRGILNDRCWDTWDNVVGIADAFGFYIFDGNSVEPISNPIANYWADGILDLANSELWSVRYDPTQRVVRLYCRFVGDTGTSRALCYSVVTQCWWEESYPAAVTAAALATVGGQEAYLPASSNGTIYRAAGSSDSGSPISYQLKTGNMALSSSPDRSLRLLYSPTPETVQLALYYNNSATPRPNAISSTIGEGFAAEAGGNVSLNMSASRSALGTATGLAAARFAGQTTDRSAGADRHIAVGISGTQTSGAVKIHGVALVGAE